MTIRLNNPDQIKEAIKTSLSIRQTLIKLNLNSKGGGGYRVLYKFIAEQNIDTSHFTGQLWSKGKTLPSKRPLEDYLNNIQPIKSHDLKKRLLKDKLLLHECSSCKLSTWLDKPIPIELDHIDGDHMNNNLSNLRILCPNCHALTDTHAGKNKGKGNYFKKIKEEIKLPLENII